MLGSVTSTTGASFNNTNDPTQNNLLNPDDPSNPGDPTNPNQQGKPVNTASQVATLQKLEQSIAKQIKQAEAEASHMIPGAQAMVAALTAQVAAIQGEINNMTSLDAMRSPQHAVTASQGNSGSQQASLLKQAQSAQQAEQKHKLTAGDANGSDSSNSKAKPFRFDLTGTVVDDMA
jgi:hypothetical protein